MEKYIKLFNNHTDYQAYINGTQVQYPNVSYCKAQDDVHYNPIDYSKMYLCTTALDDGNIVFVISSFMGTEYITSISYSTNDGVTWITTDNEDDKEEDIEIVVEVSAGDKILWKGIGQQTGYFDEYDARSFSSFFASDIGFDVEGNVMSLIYGDNFIGEDELEYVGQFSSLFCDYYNYRSCLVVNAKNLSLPATTLSELCYFCMFENCRELITAPELLATTLTEGCYSRMFYNCPSLTTAPELPATTLAMDCYADMFCNCISLTTAPELPATTMEINCYSYMFNGCENLVDAPVLPATTLVNSCYNHMFNGCTSLSTAPELPATTLVSGCYQGMFSRCTSLTTAPELPATTLVSSCYNEMFYNCTSLATAPVLPATTLAQNCYANMFSNCTSLTTAPELPATTLGSGCYHNMFNGCTNLNYIKALFTTTPSTSYTRDWVKGVSATGTFVKNSSASWSVTGNYGVPSGWTVQTASS